MGSGMVAYHRHSQTHFQRQLCFFGQALPLLLLLHMLYCKKFSDRQGVPNDDGIFHMLVFTNRILIKIHETWFKRMVAKNICFTQFLHPTSQYKAWLVANMRSVHREEKAYQKSNKRKRTNWLPWYALNFTFLPFMILMSFLLNLIKGLKCSKSPMETILVPFNLSNKRINHFIIFAYCHFFSFLFSVSCNFCPWPPCGNFCHAHGLFPYILPRSPFWVFNLVGFLCLNFFLGCFFEFST